MLDNKELKEVSAPKTNTLRCIPIINIMAGISSLSEYFIKLAQESSTTEKNISEIINERNIDDAMQRCINIAISQPDVDGPVNSTAAMKVISWVTRNSSLHVSLINSNLLNTYGRMIGRLVSAMAFNMFSANLYRTINAPNDTDFLMMCTNRILAALYITCWINSSRYQEESVLKIEDIASWIINGFNAGIAAGIPQADMSVVYHLIKPFIDSHAMPTMKISEWIGIIQKIAIAQKTEAGHNSQLPEFKTMIKMLITNEYQGYIQANSEMHDPPSLWKVLKDKQHFKFAYSIVNGSIPNIQLDMAQFPQVPNLYNGFQNTMVQQPLYGALQQGMIQQTPLMANGMIQQTPLMANGMIQQTPLMANGMIQQNPLVANGMIQQNPLVANGMIQQTPLMANNVFGMNQQTPLMANNVFGMNHVMQQNPLGMNHVMQQNPLMSNGIIQQNPLMATGIIQQNPLTPNPLIPQNQIYGTTSMLTNPMVPGMVMQPNSVLGMNQTLTPPIMGMGQFGTGVRF